MWSSPGIVISPSQIVAEALYVLEVEVSAVLDEGPSEARILAAMDDLEAYGGGMRFDVYRRRFLGAVFHPSYDPATRFSAGESALELIKSQLRVYL